jgi:hypothetical protein
MLTPCAPFSFFVSLFLSFFLSFLLFSPRPSCLCVPAPDKAKQVIMIQLGRHLHFQF